MSVDIELRGDGVGLVLSCHGPVTGHEFIRRTEELLQSPDSIRQLRYSIIDLTTVSAFDASTDQVQRVVDLEFAALAPKLLVAVIAPTDLAFGMSRMWSSLAETTGWSIRVFRQAAEANRWLQQGMDHRENGT